MKREGRGREEEDRVFRVSAEINMQRGEEGEGRGGRARKAMREENTGGRGVMSTYMKVGNGGIDEAHSIDGFPRTGVRL